MTWPRTQRNQRLVGRQPLTRGEARPGLRPTRIPPLTRHQGRRQQLRVPHSAGPVDGRSHRRLEKQPTYLVGPPRDRSTPRGSLQTPELLVLPVHPPPPGTPKCCLEPKPGARKRLICLGRRVRIELRLALVEVPVHS